MNSVILNDVNHANPCEFPKGLAETAVIENPCNKDEILVFGGFRSNDIYIYCKSTNKIKKNPVSIKNTDHNNHKRRIICAYVVSGNRKNTVIVLWCNPSCYGVFDCEKMDFDGDIIKQSNTEEERGVNVGNGSSVERWNNFLFIFGRIGLTIYDIKNEYSPKKIDFFDLTSTFNKSEPSFAYKTPRTYHRSFIVESKMENKNKVMLKFLLFGAFCETCFNNSFYQIDVDIDIENSDDDIYKIKVNCDNAKDWKMAQNIAEKYNYNSRFVNFSAHWYNSRYLIIVGGRFHSCNKTSDKIICFDYKKKKWHVGDNDEQLPMYKMPKALVGHTSLLQQENGDLYLYVFGGCRNLNYHASHAKTCWKLKLATQMDWIIERIIWIGYIKNGYQDLDTKLKNDKNDKNVKNVNVCHLARLSKDVVKVILSFLQPIFIFE